MPIQLWPESPDILHLMPPRLALPLHHAIRQLRRISTRFRTEVEPQQDAYIKRCEERFNVFQQILVIMASIQWSEMSESRCPREDIAFMQFAVPRLQALEVERAQWIRSLTQRLEQKIESAPTRVRIEIQRVNALETEPGEAGHTRKLRAVLRLVSREAVEQTQWLRQWLTQFQRLHKWEEEGREDFQEYADALEDSPPNSDEEVDL